VQSNPKLSTVLSTFNAANPSPSPDQVWTLDSLFFLPKIRLKYYRRLYGRLLKGTAPGRSDHKLLSNAVNTLDKLLSSLQNREAVGVSSSFSPHLTPDDLEAPGDANLGSDFQLRGSAASSDNQHTPASSAHASLQSIGYVVSQLHSFQIFICSARSGSLLLLQLLQPPLDHEGRWYPSPIWNVAWPLTGLWTFLP
jgi:hypothetical protein